MKETAIAERPEVDLEHIIGYELLDASGEDVGNINVFWADQTGRPSYIGVKTFWLLGKTHVVPARGAEVNHERKHVRVPFTKEDIKNAPYFDPDAELDPAKERDVMDHFQHRGMHHYQEGTMEEATIPVHEEELTVGKRTVEAGGVRLRKIVRTETVEQPVEIKREDIVIERVPAGEREPSGQPFEGEEIFIPLWREEPVIGKETHVREEVRARKTQESERRTVSGEVRKEEVEVQEERPRS